MVGACCPNQGSKTYLVQHGGNNYPVKKLTVQAFFHKSLLPPNLLPSCTRLTAQSLPAAQTCQENYLLSLAQVQSLNYSNCPYFL
jgi:hypothetical protein